ncbi:hypothetical protein KIN20_035893 [Parelaphostrongylus tenuis]|uniref:Uncharacterized protein n=1 Tax=Parelaphostrongylus tenuis TaxID=148309 RepID=A0AAD5RFB0_PARTN|nr:hypothetical protein KIN20_035893 [Parelaphostrongylus tenuis]
MVRADIYASVKTSMVFINGNVKISVASQHQLRYESRVSRLARIKPPSWTISRRSGKCAGIHIICVDGPSKQPTTATILQDTGHHYPPLFAIGPLGIGSDRSTTPSALK